jgi:hypothetical protein
MDEEKEKQIQEMTDKIFREMKEQEAKENAEQTVPQISAVQNSAVQNNNVQNNTIQNNTVQYPLRPINFKSAVWKTCGVFITCIGYIVLVVVAYIFLHSCDGSDDNIGCGQGLGWMIIIFGLPYLGLVLTNAIIGLVFVITTSKQLKKGRPGIDYPSSYNTLYYVGLALYILCMVGGVLLFTPITALFFR